MAFNVGLVGITQANKALVEILGAASNFNKQSFDNKMASIISAKQNAYEMIFNSAGFLLPIVIEGAKSENHLISVLLCGNYTSHFIIK